MLLADALGERALPQPPSVSNAGGDAGSGWLDWGLAESWEAWEDELMSLPAGGLQLNAGAGADGGKGGGQSRTAAFLAPHSLAAPLLRRGALVDASGLAALEPALQRWGVHPTLAQMSITGGKTLGVPLDGSQLLLFLRADVFSAAGLPPPASWQELLQVAERLNGTSTPAAAGAAGASDQGPLFGFCLPPPRLLGSLALAVLAPMVQTNGTREGMYLDPSSLRPAAATLAMSYALSYLRRLATLSPPSAGYPASAAPPYSEAFAQGRCAMTVGSAAQFRRNSQAVHPAGPSAVRAQVLASLLPGSELVLSEGQSPAGDSLVPCTPGLCPYAVATEASAKGGPGGATAGTSGLRRSLRRGLQQGAQALVNRAPLLSPDGLVGAIVAGGEVTAQLLSWSLLSSVGGPSTSWELLLPPGSEVGPWRQEHFQDAQRWAAAGYDAADTASFLRAAQGSLDHPNVVWPLRVEGAVTHKRAVGTAADAVVALASAPSSPLGGSSGAVEVTAGDPRVAAVMGALADAVTALFGAGKPDPALRAAYLEGLSGRLTGVLHPAVHVDVSSTAPGAHASSQPTAARIGLIVGLVIGCTAAMAAGVLALGFFLGRQQRRAAGSSYWALVEAPPPGPATCIAVTDIEGSTSLWEALPEAVLDRALRTHHRVVRTTSSLYRGYESATEGDSFILAFATPAAAASFAVALQQALLEAEWPAELLAAPSCRPVFVTRREEVERAESVSLTPPPAAKPHKQALLPGSGGIISPHGGFGESRNAAGHHHSVWHGYRAAVMALTGNRAAQKPAAKKKPAIASSLTHEASAAADHGENGAEQSSNAQQQASTRSALYNAVSAFGPGFLASRLRVSLSIAGSRPLPAQASAAHQTAGGQQRDHERGAPWEHSERSQGLLDGPSAPEAQRSRPLLGLLGRMPEQCEGDLEDSGEGAEDGAEDVLEEVDPPASNELLVKLMLAARHKRGLAISELAPVVESTGGRMANSSGLMTIGSTHPGTAGQAAEEVVALVFAGLRVRVGLHCGVQAQEIVYNPASARQTFGGEALRVAKAVTDCASGGQVVLSGEVLAQVQLAGDLSDLPAVVMDIGEHQLFEAVPTLALAEGPCLEASPVLLDAAPAPAAPSTQLLQLVSAPLLGRLALMPPFRPAIHQYTPGFMDAPIGESVAVVVFRVAHASALLAWDAAVAAESLALLELFLRASLGRLLPSASASHGPCYLAAAPPGCPLGTFVAVFANPAAAAKWALEASSQLEGLPWPQELLSSRFGAPLEGLMRAEAESRDDAAAPRHGLKRGLTKALHKAAAPHHFITQSFTASTRPRPPPQPSTRAAQARDPLRQTGASHATDELLGSFGGDLLELFGMPKGVDHGPANTLSSLLEVGDSVPGLPTAKSLPPPGTSASTQPDRGKVANDSSVRKRLMSLGQGAPTSDKTPTVASTTMTSTPIDVTTSRLLETALSTDHAATASAVNSGQQGLSAGSMLPVPAAALFDDVSYPGAPRRLARPGSRHRSAWSRTQHPGGSETVCVDIGASGGTSPPSKYHGPQLQPPQPPRISLTSTVSSSTVHPSHDIAEGRSRGGATCPPREPSSPGNTAVGAPGPALLRPRSNTAKRTLSTRVLATMGFAGSLHGSFIASRTSPASSSTTATMTAAPNPHPLLSGMATEPFARPGGGASGTSGGGGASTSPRNLATVLRRKRSGDVNQSPSRLLESAAAVAAATALAVEDAEVVTLRGLRVRAGLAVGAVRVELCPMTGRVVYSGKPVTAAMTAAAAARLGTLYATQGAATAVAARQAAEAVSEAARSGVAGADGAAEPAAGALQALAAAVGEAEPSLAALTPRLVSAPATSRVTAEAGSTGGGAPVSLKRKEAFVRFRLVEKAVRTDQDEAA